jgi:DNA-binding response OmpR family regulator
MNRFVLIADDEPMIRESVSRILEARGHEVISVGEAEDARATLHHRLPDVAVVDWKMPGGGEAVVQALLDTGRFQGRIIVISGAHEHALPLNLRKRGVMHLRKPFSFAHLVALVEERADG